MSLYVGDRLVCSFGWNIQSCTPAWKTLAFGFI